MIGAGCFFTDGNLVLAGLQIKNGEYILSGLGGRKENQEQLLDCAIREVYEELFHVKDVPHDLIDETVCRYIPKQFIQNGDYMMYVYSLWDLEDFCRLAYHYGIVSPVYDYMPTNVSDLIFRRLVNAEAEINRLCLLPIHSNFSIAPEFTKDIQLFLEKRV